MSRNLSFDPSLSEADISTLAQHFVLELYNQKNDPRLVFHSYRQTSEIVKTIHTLAQAIGCTESEWEVAAIAGWFYNVGFLYGYQDPGSNSLELAERFFSNQSFSPSRKSAILATLNAVFKGEARKTTETQVLSDAINAIQYGPDFIENAPLLRLEKELLLDYHYDNREWYEYLTQSLLHIRYYTSYAKVHFEPEIAQQLIALRQRQEKQKRKEVQIEQDDRHFSNLEERINSGAQTFFRTNYRNHINLSSIADNKANIMISVNAILISVIISVVSYRNMTETNPAILMPALIFLVTGLTSLIFAVLAARPKITSVIHENTPMDEAKKNIVFFGNFVNLKVEKFEKLLDEMFRDSELLYGNMSRDLYYLGKVLDKKYRFLSISYNVFMIGFVATVLTFLVAILR